MTALGKLPWKDGLTSREAAGLGLQCFMKVLEKEMATHSSILAWTISRTEEPGELHTVHGIAESQT